MLLVMIIPVLLLINYLVDILGHNFYSNQPLINIYDLLFIVIPRVDRKYHYLVDISAVSLAGIAVICGYGYQYLEELICILSIRAITTSVTIFPKDSGTEFQPAQNIVSIIRGHYDKVFSGHTSAVFLAALICYDNNLVPIELSIILVLFTIIGLISMRTHFTVDIVLAIVITYLAHFYLTK